MKRRAYLATATTGLTGLLAGCTSDDTTGPGAEGTPSATPTTTQPTTQSTTQTSTAEPAEFELGSIDAPRTAEIGEQISYSFTVTNTGEQTGTFETTIRSRVGNGAWSESDPWRETVEPGQNVRLSSQSFTYDYLTSLDVEITAFDEQFSIRFVGANQSWGEQYTLEDRFTMTAQDVSFADSYTWTSNNYEYEETPSEGNQWAWVSFRAENTSNTPQYLPVKSEIGLIAGNSQYSYTVSYRNDDIYEGGEVQPDIVREGDILYEVPQAVSKDDVEIAYSTTTIDGDISVYWSSTSN